MKRMSSRAVRALCRQSVGCTNGNSTSCGLRRAAPLVARSAMAAQQQQPPLVVRFLQTSAVHNSQEGPSKQADRMSGEASALEGKGVEEKEEEKEEVGEEDDGAVMAAQYLGVVYNPDNIKKYSAEIEIDEYVINGGDYWTALDAARGYDELVALYCDLDTPRNFPAGSEDAEAEATLPSSLTREMDQDLAATGANDWQVPDVGKRSADLIPVIPGAYLTLDEVVSALEREKAIDIYTIDLAGKSSLAEHMVFTTGRSMAHMRRMADMMIQSMKARALADGVDYGVEGRDCDDWMIADCSTIVVHFLREDTRRILQLEDHWENMVNDKHRVYGDMTEDEYMDKFGTSELMEYLEDDDFESVEGEDGQGGGVEWK